MPPEPTLGEIEARLWNEQVNAATYAGAGQQYQGAILEQYKLYAAMADRISARRGLANTFFLFAAVYTAAFVIAVIEQA